MRCVGPVLFSDSLLADALDENLVDIVCSDTCHILIEYGMMPRLALKRGALAWLVPGWSALSLGKPQLGKVIPPLHGGNALISLTCSVPFKGEARLLRCSAPVWPAARKIRGEVCGATLILTAEGHSGDETWLRAILASELAEVTRMAAAQAPVLRRFEKGRDAMVRALIDRVYSHIDHTTLQDAYDRAMALAGPDDLYLEKSMQTWADQKVKHWKRWWAAGESSALA